MNKNVSFCLPISSSFLFSDHLNFLCLKFAFTSLFEFASQLSLLNYFPHYLGSSAKDTLIAQNRVLFASQVRLFARRSVSDDALLRVSVLLTQLTFVRGFVEVGILLIVRLHICKPLLDCNCFATFCDRVGLSRTPFRANPFSWLATSLVLALSSSMCIFSYFFNASNSKRSIRLAFVT